MRLTDGPARLDPVPPGSKGLDFVTRRTIQDLAIAAVIAGVVAASPLTSTELLPSLALGLVAAAVFVAWRRRPSTTGVEETARSSIQVPPLVGVSFLVTVAMFAPTLEWLYKNWTGSIWSNDHGIFIPPLVAYLIWRTLQQDPQPNRGESSASGFWFLSAGLLLAVVDASVQTHYLSVLGLLLLLPGLSLLTLGARRTRALAVPIAVSLLMMPIPRTFASDLALRNLTAQGVEPIIRLAGYPVYLDLTVLHLPSGVFVVSNACSGFATLYASIAVALILAAYSRSLRASLTLLAVALPLALAANILRVVMLVLLTTWWGRWVIDSPLHEASGVAAFGLVLVCLFAISGGLGPERRIPTDVEETTS